MDWWCQAKDWQRAVDDARRMKDTLEEELMTKVTGRRGEGTALSC